MKKLRLISLFLTVLLIFTACGSDIGESFNLGMNKKNQAESRTLYLMGYNFESSNPLLVKNEVNREIFSLIYDGLYTLDSAYKPVPRLAKDASVSSDGLTWTITLNTDVSFHDGTSLSVNDVVSTIRYLLNNSTYYNYNVSCISSVVAKGRDSVEITLNKPAQNLQALLTFPIVNSKDLLGEFEFNGTGMFVVDNYIKRKYITLKTNGNYYDKTNEEIFKIEVHLMPDKETANYSYASGLSDVFSQDIFTDASSINPKTDSEVIEYVSLNYSFLLLNHSLEIFSDVNVRKAVSMAINKESVVEDVLFSHGEVTDTPIPMQSDLCAKEYSYEYNINEAKNLLEKSGYIPDVNTGILKKETPDGEKKLSFEILVNNDNNFRIQVANVVSENLKYIGIDAKVKIVSYEEYQRGYYEKTYEAFIGAVAMSPDFDLSLFMGENNVSNYYNNMAIRTLLNISLSENYQTKKEYYNTLQKIFYDDVPHISLYYTKINLQHSPKIKKGLLPNGFSIYNNIENWSFEE